LESNLFFRLIFQLNIFNSSTMINGSFPINSRILRDYYSDCWVFFFSERASIGDFIFLYMLPVHRGVLSVVTLNDRALVPIGEYNIIPPFHVGSTPRTVGRTHRSSCICHD
jgi:hypothetical protein